MSKEKGKCLFAQRKTIDILLKKKKKKKKKKTIDIVLHHSCLCFKLSFDNASHSLGFFCPKNQSPLNDTTTFSSCVCVSDTTTFSSHLLI